MTTATLPTDVPAGPGVLRAPDGHYGMVGVLKAEWTKLRSVRSTAWTLVAFVVAILGLGIAISAGQASHWNAGNGPGFDPTNVSLAGFFLGQLIVGILGALVVTAEYGTGTIRATLSASPLRLRFLLAKTAVFGTLLLVASEILSFAVFFIGQAILGTSAAPTATLGQPNVLRAVIGAGLYVTVLGLLAVGFGFIIRHTAGTIAAFVGVVLVLPLFTLPLPEAWRHDVFRYFPASIGNQVLMTVHGPEDGGAFLHPFSPWVGLAVLTGYAVAALVVGGWLLNRRDA